MPNWNSQLQILRLQAEACEEEGEYEEDGFHENKLQNSPLPHQYKTGP